MIRNLSVGCISHQEVLRTAFGVFLGVHSFQFHHAGGIWEGAGSRAQKHHTDDTSLPATSLRICFTSVFGSWYTILPWSQPTIVGGSQHTAFWRSLLPSGYESNLNGYTCEASVPFAKTISYCCRLFFHSHKFIPSTNTFLYPLQKQSTARLMISPSQGFNLLAVASC